MFGATATQTHNPNKDIEVTSPPADSISGLSWAPKANFLVSTSWDNVARCWEIQNTGQTTPKAEITLEAPPLCSVWSSDCTKVFVGGCDNKIKCWTLATNQATPIAQHQEPIKYCFWVDEIQMLVTGSWDKTIGFWDGRQATPTHVTQLPERVYCMDVKKNLCVVGTADRSILVYDVRNPGVQFKRIESPLKFQSRVVSAFPDISGFALGSIEGRIAIHHIDSKDQMKDFAFKCHRDGNEIYAINSINFHPVFGTFATAGSDGTFNFWDKDSRQRLKAFNKCNAPITSGSFNHDGTIYAYSVSYDWHKGIEHYNPQQSNYIFLHSTQEAEIKPRNSNQRGPQKKGYR